MPQPNPNTPQGGDNRDDLREQNAQLHERIAKLEGSKMNTKWGVTACVALVGFVFSFLALDIREVRQIATANQNSVTRLEAQLNNTNQNLARLEAQQKLDSERLNRIETLLLEERAARISESGESPAATESSAPASTESAAPPLLYPLGGDGIENDSPVSGTVPH